MIIRCILIIWFLTAGEAVSGELMRLIREPTAGIVAPGTYHFSMNTFPDDGLRFSFTAGIFSGFAAGLGYGGWNITGLSSPSWFDHLYLNARFRFIDETESFPAAVLGFDNEPEALHTGSTYVRKARDLYLVFSKNFLSFGGDIAFHFGINADISRLVHVGAWTGMNKALPGGFGLALEYDFATNEDDSVRFDNNGGFMSGEIYWESYGQVRISLQFIDIFRTGGESYRALGVDFLGLL